MLRDVYVIVICAAAAFVWPAALVKADSFGSGDSQFSIDFVTISAATNPASGYGIVAGDYRMGVCEISNSQWGAFKVALGLPVTGIPSEAYSEEAFWTHLSAPANNVSWYEAAQFVNYLNMSRGHHAAYRFTGTQGSGDYALAVWSPAEADGGVNLYRHKDAFYYLPTEDEWVKAAYWTGASLQTYATKTGAAPHQGDGVSPSGWNFRDGGQYTTDPPGPWPVGSGSEELNGTYDMMGNVVEWTESPFVASSYTTTSIRALRGGGYSHSVYYLASSDRNHEPPVDEHDHFGFRVAADVLPIGGDADCDGDVDLADFNTLKSNFQTGTLWSEGNFNDDAVIDLADFNILKTNFSGAWAALGTIPEPTTLMLLVGFSALFCGRKRRS